MSQEPEMSLWTFAGISQQHISKQIFLTLCLAVDRLNLLSQINIVVQNKDISQKIMIKVNFFERLTDKEYRRVDKKSIR